MREAGKDVASSVDWGKQSKREFVRSEIAGVRTELANLEARLFRHMRVMAIGIVGATFTLLKLFP